MLSKKIKVFFFVYICLIILSLITGNFIIPYIEPTIIPNIEKYVDKKYHKSIVIVLSVTMTMPIMFFIIIPNINHLIS